MSNDESAPEPQVDVAQVARPFARLGWIGFWIQVGLATLPIILLLYVLLRSPPVSGSGRGVDIREYVAFGSLLVLLFTIWWCYRYTQIAERMRTPATRPAAAAVLRTLWIGVTACCVGAFISIALLLSAIVRLLFIFMLTPQGGVPVIQTTASDRLWVSAIDMVDLLTMVLTLTAEFVVLTLSLWLLFHMLRAAAGYERAAR